jgi:DNA-binding NarL/FixJ family response regulator
MTWFSTRTTVMALDALPPVGRGLARVLAPCESVNWAGLAIDLESWREMLLCIQPDVALIDPRGFRRTSADLIRLTNGVSPDTKVILFVPTISEPIVQRWYDAGADACITKAMHPDLIREVIENVHNNIFERYFLAERVAPTSASA